MTHTASGVHKFDMFDPQGHHSHNEQPWPDSITGYGQQIFVSPGYTISKEGKGTIVYQFDYLDYGGNSLASPFDHTWVKKTANASWGATTNTDGTITGSGYASDGLGDPQVNGVSQGIHYEKKDTGGGSFSVSVDLRSSVAGPSPVGNGSSGSGGEGGSVSVQDVGIALISSDIENSTKKGGAPNARARDGSISVDSVAVYDPIGGMWRGESWLTANCPFDDPLYTWTAIGGTPSTYDNSNVLGITTSTLSGIPLNMGLCASQDGLPMTTSVTAKVASATYSDATDNASCTINWHAPYEAISPGICPTGKDVIETRFSGIGPSDFGSAPESAAKPLEFEVYAEGALIIAFFSGQEELAGLLEIVCHICHITQAALDYFAPDEPPVTIGNRNDGTSWSTAVGDGNVPAGMEGNPNGWGKCTLSLCRVAHWSDPHWNCDKYDHHGWVTGGPYDVHGKKVDYVIDEPYFTLIPGNTAS